MAPGSSQSDQITSDLRAGERTFFAGISSTVKIIDFGTRTVLPNGKVLVMGMIAEWYDDADPDDEYVTGQ